MKKRYRDPRDFPIKKDGGGDGITAAQFHFADRSKALWVKTCHGSLSNPNF
jgi:hypothetical protein